MTYRTLCRLFAAEGIPDAQAEARILFCHISGKSAAALLADPEIDYPGEDLTRLAAERCAGVPLQYLLGEAFFYEESYRVTPDVLIPRSDTEILVEEAIRTLPRGGIFADLCTGSGCIAISVLAHRPDLTAHAFDISPAALSVAAENAKRNGVADRIEFFSQDLLTTRLPAIYAGILSNPPYISSAVIPTLSREVKREPILALDGGEDGLLFYQSFLKHFPQNLHPGGSFYFEIGFDQENALRALAEEHHFSFSLLRDLSQNPRCAILTKPQ